MGREIIIEPFNEEWAIKYKQAESLLKDIFKDIVVDIQHIGSTSIKGLSAKPTIDILIIVSSIEEVNYLNETMQRHGFIAKGEHGITGRRYFYKTLPQNVFMETYHVHVYQKDNPKYNEELIFRDYLKNNVDSLKMYEALKIELAKKHRHDPLSYTNAKADFILKTIEKARLL